MQARRADPESPEGAVKYYLHDVVLPLLFTKRSIGTPTLSDAFREVVWNALHLLVITSQVFPRVVVPEQIELQVSSHCAGPMSHLHSDTTTDGGFDCG